MFTARAGLFLTVLRLKCVVISSKFQHEVKLGRHMCLRAWVCVCVRACTHVCVTNNRLWGNCRGLQRLWAGPRHHPSIWRWGWVQFDIPVCLCLHHFGPKRAGSGRLRAQVVWCRRGSLKLYFTLKKLARHHALHVAVMFSLPEL